MKTKKYAVLSIIIFLSVIVGFFLIYPKQKKTISNNLLKNNHPSDELVIPTIDSSVKVELIPLTNKREVSLNVDEIPNSTESVDYELSYQTKEQGLQGVIGTITLNNIEKKFEKKITLGTCSSGRCVYHEVVSKIKLTLKFTGNYGEKIFEKEFEI